jgi:hypothetical protein
MSLRLPSHTRYPFSPIVERPKYKWPGGKDLAFYIGLNVEHFAFMSGRGSDPHQRGGGRHKRSAITPGALLWRNGRLPIARSHEGVRSRPAICWHCRYHQVGREKPRLGGEATCCR